MAENKNKTILEDAVNDLNHIKAALKANTKEILRSTLKEEISEAMNDSMDYEDEAMDDFETDDAEVSAEPDIDAAPDAVADTTIGADAEGGLDYEDAEGGLDNYEDDAEMDLTGADNDTVIKVFKQLTGDDQIEVVGDTVTIKVNEPGEYVVKLPSQETTTDVVPTDLAPADDVTADIDVDGDTEVADLDDELDGDDAELDIDTDLEVDDEEETTSDDEEEKVDGVEEAIYEIEIDEYEQIAEEEQTGKPNGKGHDTEVKAAAAPNKGEIEGQKASEDKETSGDNLEGGFDKKHNGKNGNHAEHVMETEEDAIDGEESEETEELEESIPVGIAQARRVPGKNTPIKGAGAKAVKESAQAKYNTLVEKYNELVRQTKQHIKENAELREVVGKFRTMLGENVVYTTNLSYVAKLFSEHSFTKEEKKQILDRFDEEATSIKESKKIYKSIISEIANKPTIKESVSKVVDGSTKTTSTSQLNESVAYSNPMTGRIMNLIDRVENSGKYN